MNKNFKKAALIAMSAVLVTASFAGCGKDDNKPSQTAKLTETKVIAEADGITIDSGLFNYYIYQAAVNNVYSADPTFNGDFSGINWDEKDENGVKRGDKVKELALKELLGKQLLNKLGTDNGVSISDEEKNQASDSVTQFLAQYGEEALNANMAAMGLASSDDYLKLYELETLSMKVEEDFEVNKDKYISVNLEDYADPDKVCAQHILIQNESEKTSDPKATIDEVLARARNGEDFAALMKEFNEDTAEPESGYCFGKGEMVAEFENAAFALGYNEISDVVKTEYGYHIIKRVAGIAELKNYLIQASEVKKFDDAIDGISVADVLKSTEEAIEKVQEISAAAQASNGADK